MESENHKSHDSSQFNSDLKNRFLNMIFYNLNLALNKKSNV